MVDDWLFREFSRFPLVSLSYPYLLDSMGNFFVILGMKSLIPLFFPKSGFFFPIKQFLSHRYDLLQCVLSLTCCHE